VDEWTTRFLALTTAALAELEPDVDINQASTIASTQTGTGVLVTRTGGHTTSAVADPSVPRGAIYYRD
jgi:hypothetical protein